MKQVIPFTKEITFKSKIGELLSISLDHDLVLKGEDLIVGNFYIKGSYKMLSTSVAATDYSYKIPVEIAISDDYDTYDATIDIDDFRYSVKDEAVLEVQIDVVIDHLEKKTLPVKEEKVFRLSDLKQEEEDRLDDAAKKEDVMVHTHVEDEDLTVQASSVSKSDFSSSEEEKLNEELARRKEENTELELEISKKRELAKELEEELKLLNSEKEKIAEREDVNPMEILATNHKEVFETTEETYQTYSVYVVKEEDTLEKILENYKIREENLRDYNEFSEIVCGMKLIIPSTLEN